LRHGLKVFSERSLYMVAAEPGYDYPSE